MRNLFKIIIATITSIFITGCEKMDEYKKYAPEGETIYAPATIGIQVFPGKDRIKLKWYIMNGSNVENCIIEYGEGALKKVVPVNLKAPKDSVEIVLDQMEERSYLFNVYGLDKNGNRSVKKQITGMVYGSKYQLSIANRFLSEVTTNDNGAVLKWAAAQEGCIGTEITYKNKLGVVITRMVPVTEAQTSLVDWEANGDLTYKSFYMPDIAAIDTFVTAVQVVKLPVVTVKIAKDGWSIIDFSSQSQDGGTQGNAVALIDNDDNNIWHSQWQGTPPPYPHWVSVDMGANVSISSFECTRRIGDSGGPSRVRFEVSDNGSTWTEVGTFNFPTDPKMKFTLESRTTARYFKFVAVAGPNTYTHMAELSVYGSYE